METFTAVFSEGRVIVPARNEADSLYSDGYGSFSGENRVLALDSFEGLYLVERGKITVIDEESHERLVFKEMLMKVSSGDPFSWTRYIIYKDLRTRGFVAKRGPGNGVDFLVYERGSHGRKPPRYLVYAIWEGSQEPLKHLSDVLAGAKAEGRVLRLAVVDRRGEIVYYTLSEMGLERGGP
jgi:tRNA-intron endonuclease